MKKLHTLLLLLTLSTAAAAQITIEKHVDDMTDKVSYEASERFYVADNERSSGFAIDVVIDIDNGKLYSKGWIVTTADLGGCNEDNDLIILFEDGSRMNLKSFSKFNCDEVAFFYLDLQQEAYIATKRIKKMRFRNGYSYETYTAEVEVQDYFIQLYDAIENENY